MADVTLDLAGFTPVFLPLTPPTGAASNLIASGRCLIGGWDALNPGAAAERFDLLDGKDASGGRIGGAIVPLSDTRSYSAPGPGIYCQAGVFAVVAGADLVIIVYVAYLP